MWALASALDGDKLAAGTVARGFRLHAPGNVGLRYFPERACVRERLRTTIGASNHRAAARAGREAAVNPVTVVIVDDEDLGFCLRRDGEEEQ